MIDIARYAKALLPIEEANEVNKLFGKIRFVSLYQTELFFAEQKNLQNICKKFSVLLKDQQVSLEDKITLVLEKCDFNDDNFQFLDAKGSSSVTCVCPKCKGVSGKSKKAERAWIPANGTAKRVMCQHRSSCGFQGDFIAAYAEEYSLSYGKALNLLANEYNIDFTVGEFHLDGTSKPIPLKEKLVSKVIAPKEIEYMVFDAQKEYLELDYTKYLNKYALMTDEQQFKMLATAIYQFSLTTKQWGKEKYYKSIGISKKNPLLKEKIEMIESSIGYLFKTDIPLMIEQLKKLFPIEDLIKYGLIHEKDHYFFSHQFKNDVKEGLVVVPNFDMYTNMCTGLKFRKTMLAVWIDKTSDELVVDSNKEPEFSYGRIARPLPYHLTRVALLDLSYTFRFFEGQKDLHSMPFRNGVCDVAIPGVNGISIEMLGLFKGRIVELYFDQDKEGQKGAAKLKILLEKAGAIVTNKKWDLSLGTDVNEVLQNNKIQYIQ